MRPPLLIRLSNAWDALRGRPANHKTFGDWSISLDVDTSKFEAALKRAKDRLSELVGLVEATSKLPSPRLMVKTDRKLSQENQERVRECVRLAAESGKVMVFEQGMTFYQLVDGKWQPIDGAKPDLLTEDEARIAEGWTKEEVVSEAGIVEVWVEPADADLLKAKTQSVDETAAEWSIPADRLRAD